MRSVRGQALVIGLGLTCFLIGLTLLPAAEKYDVLIRGARIVDGTGRPGFDGDIAIQGEKIVAVGDVIGDAAIVIEAKGLVVCPGFVDTHSHVDRGIPSLPLAESYIMQGVTTALSGNCGGTPAPGKSLAFGEWMSRVEQSGTSLNIAPLVGLTTTIRELVMGADFKRPATPAEIEAMKSGAFGISTGLDPGSREYASRDEIIECAKVARKWGGLYESHTRNHQNNWYAAGPGSFGYGILNQPKGEVMAGRYHGLLQAIETARLADNIPLIIAPFTPAYTIPQPHSEWLQAAVAKATLEDIIDPAWKRGQRVYFNVIACPSSVGWLQPMIDPLLGAGRWNADQAVPPWLRGLTKDDFIKNLGQRGFRDKLREHIFSGRFKFDMINPVTDPYWMDCYEIMTCRNKKYEGKTIGELARQRSPGDTRKAVYVESLEVMFDTLAEDPDTTWALILDKREWPGALPVFLKHPAGMPTQDGGVGPAELDLTKTTLPSPEMYSHMTLYIDTYVNQRKALTLEEAIYKIGGMPAEILDLKDRGTLKVGSFADITVFDLGRIRMTADFKTPNRPPDGIAYVFVNGKLSYKNKTRTGAKAGKLLRHTQ